MGWSAFGCSSVRLVFLVRMPALGFRTAFLICLKYVSLVFMSYIEIYTPEGWGLEGKYNRYIM